MTLALRYAARSDVGLVRSMNQDSGYAGPQLLVLADGMGGPAGGDIASSVAVAHLAPLDGEAHGGDDLLDHLRGAVMAAHRDLAEYSRNRPELAGLGTTVIALLRSGRKLAMVHIGDSRAYLLHAGELTQVTEDHTFVQHLVDTGQLSPEDAEHHPQRSVLLRVLGDGEAPPVLDESVREAHAGDRWVLCSDGLSSYVSAETIAATVREVQDPAACAEALIALALRSGGPDNITIVVADVVDVEDLPATAPQIVGSAAVDRSRPTRGGNSAAARAAALTARSTKKPTKMTGTGTGSDDVEHDQDSDVEHYRDSDAEDDGDLDLDHPPRRRALTWILSAAVAGALLAGGLTIAYRWTQTQYYVGVDQAHVTLFRGIPQSLGPIELSHVYERSDVAVADLPPFAQDRVERTIAAGDLGEAETILADLLAQAGGGT